MSARKVRAGMFRDPVMGAVDTVARYTLGAIMSGVLNLMMYFPLLIILAIIVFLVLGLFFPYHATVPQNYRQDTPTY